MSTAHEPQRRVPLMERPLDMLYFIFFLSHIPATLCVDLQAFYPTHLIPTALSSLLAFYTSTSNDPIISPLFPTHPTQSFPFDSSSWFRSLLALEGLFQLPTFFIGAYGLYKGSRMVWLLLLVYGASTVTTLIPVLAVVLGHPRVGEMAAGGGEKVMVGSVQGGQRELKPEQLAMLLASYIPFLVLPLMITIDMSIRLGAIVKQADAQKLKTI